MNLSEKDTPRPIYPSIRACPPKTPSPCPVGGGVPPQLAAREAHSDADRTNAFGEFWQAVGRTENHIRQYGHVGWHPGRQDGWDERFEQAYDNIHPHLAPLRRPRVITVPAEAWGFNPFEAETGHQALMYFLNPAENLFGQVWILNSPEYFRTKQQAMAELTQLQSPPASLEKPAHPHPAVRDRTKRPRENSQRQNDAFLLGGYLIHYHKPPDGDPIAVPLSQKEIGRRMGWRQDRASRAMKVLFPEGGMKGYKSQFISGRIPRGFLRRGDHGTCDVEAFDDD